MFGVCWVACIQGTSQTASVGLLTNKKIVVGGIALTRMLVETKMNFHILAFRNPHKMSSLVAYT